MANSSNSWAEKQNETRSYPVRFRLLLRRLTRHQAETPDIGGREKYRADKSQDLHDVRTCMTSWLYSGTYPEYATVQELSCLIKNHLFQTSKVHLSTAIDLY